MHFSICEYHNAFLDIVEYSPQLHDFGNDENEVLSVNSIHLAA